MMFPERSLSFTRSFASTMFGKAVRLRGFPCEHDVGRPGPHETDVRRVGTGGDSEDFRRQSGKDVPEAAVECLSNTKA